MDEEIEDRKSIFATQLLIKLQQVQAILKKKHPQNVKLIAESVSLEQHGKYEL